MEISVSGQAAAFGGALLLGMAVGLLYDLLRIPRACIRVALLGGALDLLFWLTVTAALFLYAVTTGNGEVRIFMSAALFGGATVYFLLLSPWVRKLSGLIVSFVATVWHFFTLPFVKLCQFVKKLKEKLKNSFSSLKKRFRMNLKSVEKEVACGGRTETGGRRKWQKPKGRDS